MKIGNVKIELALSDQATLLRDNEDDRKAELKTKMPAVRFTLGGHTTEILTPSLVGRVRLFSDIEGKKSNLLGAFYVNEKKFFLFTDKFKDLYVSDNLNNFLHVKQKLRIRIAGKWVYVFGKLTHNSREKYFRRLRMDGCKKTYPVRRPLASIGLKNFAIGRIPLSTVTECDDIHTALSLGTKKESYIPVRCSRRKRKKQQMLYLSQKKVNDKMVIARTSLNGRMVIVTRVPFSREYKRSFRAKVLLAREVARIVKLFKSKKVNLYFEKESSRAQESGYYVFKQTLKYVNRKKHATSKNYFILDKKADEYPTLKKTYGSSIVSKYSFRHCVLIFVADHFISSEMSNHVLNPRLYNATLNSVVNRKPLIFLQHGIMFAKPVDNPAAMGFWKEKTPLNVYRSVISSDLEATQFHKMGYSDGDLIKCGLPKFDLSRLDKGADKILFMPTYRYWEEAKIFDKKKITETSYYQLFINIIKEFEKAKLIDQLVLAPHPKFADYIAEVLPEYASLISTNIDEALAKARIFITDYSSASYDAHYRGAAVLYYWKEKDYLIENYQAIPPVDETNCDGKPVYSEKELTKEVKRLIDTDYKVDSLYKKRYKKINEFSDNKNAERLLKELSRLEVL